MYYLDNAATTIPHPEVLKNISELYLNCFGNPSSVHPAGQEAQRVLNDARKTLAAIFNVPQAGIIFCGSGTESDNLAIKGFLHLAKKRLPGIVISPLEHAAVAKTCEWLERQKMAKVSIAQIDKKNGQLDLDHFSSLIDENTSLISIQHVNSETGTVQDLAKISQIARSQNPEAIIHSDGVQAFTRIPVNLADLGVDLYSISSHKFHGVKGCGALILNRNLKPEPIIHGGGQEGGFRSGTENVVGVSAMAFAAKIAVEELDSNLKKIRQFTDKFKNELKMNFPDCRIYDSEIQIPHILSVSFPGILGEVLLHHLAQEKIYVSTGSACNATSKKLSAVLQAVGYSKDQIMETIRISLAASALPAEEKEFFEDFIRAVSQLRKMMR